MSEQAVAVKKQKVDALKEKIESASVMIFADYRGLTVKEITELRKKLRQDGSEFKVLKNTLLARAIAPDDYEAIKNHLNGPTALMLGYRDPVGSVKTLVEYINDLEKGTIKVGIVEKQVVESKQIEAISKLPAKEVLLAKVVRGLQAPLYAFNNVLAGTLRKLLYGLNALKEKKGVGCSGLPATPH